MRARSLLLALMVVLLPLSAAQSEGPRPAPGDSSDDSSESHSNSTSSSPPHDAPECASDGEPQPQDSEECRAKYERYCAAYPHDERCRSHDDADGNESGEADNETHDGWDGNATSPNRGARWCAAPGLTLPQAAACRRFLQEFRDGVEDDHWVTFRVDEENLTLLSVRVGGQLVLTSLQLEAGSDNVSVERIGGQLLLGDNDTRLAVHDDPTGLIRFKGDDGHLVMTFPAGVVAEAHPQGFRIHYSSGQVALLLAEDAVWLDNTTVVVASFGAFHVPARGLADDRHPEAAEADEHVRQAIENRRIGAEVSLRAPEADAPLAAASGEGNESVEVLAYDDVEVKVDDAGLADPGTPIRVEVSSELDQGRTIVIHLDESLLESGDPDDLLLRYFDLYNQTDGTVLETEVLFAQAESLVDVLDPANDGGQPEYWIVEDADGLQVLFSVPHWSVHAITIASIATVVGPPSVVFGIVVGSAAAVMATAMLVWPRRRDDDF